MKCLFLLLAIVVSTTASMHAQTVSLKPSDHGLLVEIDGKLFTDYYTKDVPRPNLVACA